MKIQNARLISLLFLLIFTGAGLSAGDSALKNAIDGDHRTEDQKARNKYRHPYQTLSFFGIKPDMTAVEIWPGGGWYTSILAPYLKDQGKFYAAGYDLEPTGQYKDYLEKTNAKFKETFVDHPETYGVVHVTELAPPNKVTIAPAGSADMVVTFRNLHNWLPNGTEKDILAAVHKALKPGGIFGVIDHRADMSKEQDPMAGNGRVREDFAVKLIEGAGFKLVGKSDINNNPKDKKGYEKGVWTLPPTLALGDQDKDQYLAVGESDRFTLKFVKQ